VGFVVFDSFGPRLSDSSVAHAQLRAARAAGWEHGHALANCGPTRHHRAGGTISTVAPDIAQHCAVRFALLLAVAGEVDELVGSQAGFYDDVSWVLHEVLQWVILRGYFAGKSPVITFLL
jgi:hypothetical protein